MLMETSRQALSGETRPVNADPGLPLVPGGSGGSGGFGGHDGGPGGSGGLGDLGRPTDTVEGYVDNRLKSFRDDVRKDVEADVNRHMLPIISLFVTVFGFIVVSVDLLAKVDNPVLIIGIIIAIGGMLLVMTPLPMLLLRGRRVRLRKEGVLPMVILGVALIMFGFIILAVGYLRYEESFERRVERVLEKKFSDRGRD